MKEREKLRLHCECLAFVRADEVLTIGPCLQTIPGCSSRAHVPVTISVVRLHSRMPRARIAGINSGVCVYVTLFIPLGLRS